MYCSQCGSLCPDDGKFCSKCGARRAPTDVPNSALPESDKKLPAELENIGAVVHHWGHVPNLSLQYPTRPAIYIEGTIASAADVIFTDKLLLLAASAPQSKAKQVADKLAANSGGLAFGLGVVGAGVAALTGGVASAIDKINEDGTRINRESLLELYDSGLLIFAPKNSLQFKVYALRKPIFFTHHRACISGKFTHRDGPIELCVALGDEKNFNDEVVVKKGLSKAGCLSIDAGKATYESIYAELNVPFPWVYNGKWPKGEFITI